MVDYRLTPDGVQARQATKEDLDYLKSAEARLLQLRAPLLLETERDRVAVLAIDGTGNNLYKDDPNNFTLVGRLSNDLLKAQHPSIATTYVPGIGTQSDYLASRVDGALAVTFRPRVEQAYYEFCLQAARWMAEDPGARIHVIGIGFSRGAEQTPALQRLIHERGIRDPDHAKVSYDSEGLLRNITYSDLPLLVPPGRTLQVALIHDPVATSVKDQARALPSSNVSALGFTALHESRGMFDATLHLREGLSEHGRVANFFSPGAHADNGGGYLLDGISRRIHNMDVDYLNSMFGQPLLEKVPVPTDPRLYVIHRSDQHQLGVIPTSYYREQGERRVHTDLAPGCRSAAEPCGREPVDHDLAATVQWRHVERGPTPGGTDRKMDIALAAIDRMHEREPRLLENIAADSTVPLRAELLVARDHVDQLFERLADAAARNSAVGMAAVAKAYMDTPAGQVFKSIHQAAQAWSSYHANPERSRNLGSDETTQLEQSRLPGIRESAAPLAQQP